MFDIDESLLSYMTPPLILQPLAENAIAHGVLKRAEGGQVNYYSGTARRRHSSNLQDNGVGLSKKKVETIFAEKSTTAGIGLANVQKRILRLTKQSLKITSVENEGTTISYWIPLFSKETKVEK